MDTLSWNAVLQAVEFIQQGKVIAAYVGVGMFICILAYALWQLLADGGRGYIWVMVVVVSVFMIIVLITVGRVSYSIAAEPIELTKVGILDEDAEELREYTTPIWVEDNAPDTPYYTIEKGEGKDAEVIVTIHCSMACIKNSNMPVRITRKEVK